MTSRIIALLLMVALLGIVLQYPLLLETNRTGVLATSLGAVILFAYLLGEILSRIKLPRISGYLFAGMILGPYISGLLTHQTCRDFALIDQIALALIALSAGGELQLNSLRQRIGGISLMTLMQTVFLFIGGTLSFFFLARWLPLIQDLSTANRFAAAMVFGVISIAQSPSSTIAIITELRSSGKATETILGVAVIKDVLVIMLFALLIPIVKVIELGGEFELAFLINLGTELAISFGAGIAAGWLISLYLKHIKIHPVLFVLAFCYLVSEGSKTFHLDTLIVCIIAGFWVTNASKKGKELIEMIEGSSLIIYVIFFCITGATLDLFALQSVWEITLALVLVRMLLLSLATETSLKLTRDTFQSPHTLWMSFIAQAGVSLGLITILQREGISWGSSLKTIVVATIALNQIIGPITLKIALQKAGEAKKSR